MSTTGVILHSIGSGIVWFSAFLVHNLLLILVLAFVITIIVRCIKRSSMIKYWMIKNKIKEISKSGTPAQKYLFKNPGNVIKRMNTYPDFVGIIKHLIYSRELRGDKISEEADFEVLRIIESFWTGKVKALLNIKNHVINFEHDNGTHSTLQIGCFEYYGFLSYHHDNNCNTFITRAETKVDVHKLEEYLKTRYPHGAYHYYDGAKTDVKIL